MQGLGVKAEKTEDGLLIMPSEIKGGIINSYHDHRIAMALTLLLTLTGGSLETAEAVAKSYPDFYKQISKLGIDLYETY